MPIEDFVTRARQAGYNEAEIDKFLEAKGLKLTGAQRAVERIPQAGAAIAATAAQPLNILRRIPGIKNIPIIRDIGFGAPAGALGATAAQPIRAAGRALLGTPGVPSPVSPGAREELRTGAGAGARTGAGIQAAFDIGKIFKGLKNIPKNIGGKIQDIKETSAANYPAKLLKQEVQEKGSQFLKTPEGKKGLMEILGIIDENTTKEGLVSAKDIFEMKQAWQDKGFKEGSKLFKMASSVVRDVLVGPEGIEPAFRIPLSTLSTIKKVKKTIPIAGARQVIRRLRRGL